MEPDETNKEERQEQRLRALAEIARIEERLRVLRGFPTLAKRILAATAGKPGEGEA